MTDKLPETGPAETDTPPRLEDPRRAASLMRRATYASVAAASLLVAVKTIAYLMTDSVALLSSLVDSILDVAASAINLFAVHQALTPADEEHRFGHGKAESLAGLFQAAFIAGSAVFLIFQAGERLLHPQPLDNSAVGIAVMVLSILVTGLLVLYQRYVIRASGSVAIKADSLHYVSDLLTNLGVILALVLATAGGWLAADPLIALAVAGFILYSAWQIVHNAFGHLMDRELPDDEREKIIAVALAHPEVLSLHDLRTRSSGVQVFIQFHLEMDGYITLLRAHEIADEVEAEIMAAFPGAEVIIHQDPSQIEEDMPDFADSHSDTAGPETS
jgi:ferrous-iron efflux pump FieF